ncbi:MAG: acyl-CoA dehydrogenase family protein [Chloroflexi bacterium]|nr:acyl-CoA dehydrogenase family protein [Chloroflexota bacterium]
MDFRFTAEEDAFRAEVREFIKKEMPASLAEAMAQGEGYEPELWDLTRTLRKKLAAKGWIGVSWPKEYGGMGKPPTYQAIFKEEMAYWRCPGIDAQAYQLGPAIIVHGTEEIKKKYLGGIARAEVTWCQGFSEPNAGSDLASLQTRAVRDGDDWVINGQKIWTSGAHTADYIHLLARTDPNAPKHKGITYFLFSMHTPGVTVKPIRQMDNGQGFNEVYFDNVRIPANSVFGEVNRGWYVATTTLDFERSNVANSAAARRNLTDLLAFLKGTPTGKYLLRNPLLRYRFADMMVQNAVARNLSYRVIAMQAKGLVPNMEASLAKLFSADANANAAWFAMDTVSLYGQLEPGTKYTPLLGQIERSYLRTGCRVGGGSPEIQRNVIAQRGLGLPR